MANKTPMQEMIDFCEENQDGMMPPKEFLFKAFELREKEKQVIEDAYFDAKSENGGMGLEFDEWKQLAQAYYNEKFNNK
jgi:hypothetical protein